MIVKCSKCSNFYENTSKWGIKKFCSKKCANSRGVRSEEIRNKISNSLKGRNVLPETIDKIKNTKIQKGSIILTYCKVCSSPTKLKRKTCSKECYTKLAAFNASKNNKFRKSNIGHYKGILVESTYELAFLIFHLDHNSNISRCNEVREYFYEGKKRYYYPDFIIDDKTYEIKGYYDDVSKAKHNSNMDVILLGKDDLNHCFEHIKRVYKKDIKELYDEPKFNFFRCKNCNKEFKTFKKDRIFCSRQCSGKFRRKENIKNDLVGWFKSS